MSNGDNLTALLNQAIRNRMAELQTAMPAQIISYDFKTQKAAVQPTINRRYADGRVEPYPVINNVPVIFPRSGGASMTFPVTRGDTVLLVFSSRSIDTWTSRGGKVDQDDRRMHDINDAIAIPGLIPFSAGSKAKNNSDVLLTYAGSEVTLKQDGKAEIKSAHVTIDSPETYMTGDLVVKQDIYDRDKEYGTFNRIRDIYNEHTHDENNDTTTNQPNQQLGIWNNGH